MRVHYKKTHFQSVSQSLLKNPRFSWWDKCSGSITACPHCDEAMSLYHITVSPCQTLSTEFGPVINTLNSAGTTALEAINNGKLNEALFFVDFLRNSSVGHLF